MKGVQFLADAMIRFFFFTTASRPALGPTYPTGIGSSYPG